MQGKKGSRELLYTVTKHVRLEMKRKGYYCIITCASLIRLLASSKTNNGKGIV